MSWPPTRMLPALGVSNPSSRLTGVVLPPPEAPTELRQIGAVAVVIGRHGQGCQTAFSGSGLHDGAHVRKGAQSRSVRMRSVPSDWQISPFTRRVRS